MALTHRGLWTEYTHQSCKWGCAPCCAESGLDQNLGQTRLIGVPPDNSPSQAPPWPSAPALLQEWAFSALALLTLGGGYWLLCHGGLCYAFWRFGSISGLCPLMAVALSPKSVCKYCQMSPGGSNHPHLRTVALEHGVSC